MSLSFLILVVIAASQLASWRRMAQMGRNIAGLGEVRSKLRGLVTTQDYDHKELGRVMTDLETAVQESVAEMRMGANTLTFLKDFLVSELATPGSNGGSDG